MNNRLLQWAKALRREVLLLWLAARDARVPLLAKLLAALVVGYALSPIDLIPDFIPVIGFLDDVLLVPLGIWLTLRLTPAALLADCKQQAAAMANQRLPTSRAGLVAVLIIWTLAIAGAFYFFWIKRYV